MSPNHLLIGLGGTGGKILRAFRKIVFRDCRSLQPDGVTLEYLYIDSSDEMMSPTDPSWKVLGESVQLKPSSQLHLSSADLPSRLRNIDAFPNIRGWIGDPEIWKDILNIGAGAKILGGQKRRLGRFLFACHIKEFMERLTNKMQLLRQGGSRSPSGHTDVTIHIFSGLAGGTGSGSLIDVITQIRKEYNKNCKIYLYLLLPERHPNNGWNTGNYHANGYAALMELNALSVGRYFPYDLGGNGNRVTDLPDPFQACYLITNENDNEPPIQFDVEKAIPETIAMFLYQKIVAGADGKWPDLKRIEEWENKGLAHESTDPKVPERSRLFISFGMKQISYPEDEIRDYLSYSLSQQACLQLLYNNWAGSYQAQPKSFKADGYVTLQPVREKWNVTREHLFLEKRFSHDDIDGEQAGWRKMDDSWRAFVDQVIADVRSVSDGNSVAAAKRKCQERFDTGFSGGEGVKGFYQRRLNRADEYAATIVKTIEDDLLRDVFSGGQSLSACADILNALSQQLERSGIEWKKICEKALQDAAKAKEKVNKNVEEYQNLGPLAKAFGLRVPTLEAAQANLYEYFRNISTAEAWTFVDTILRSIEEHLNKSRNQLQSAVASLQIAVTTCEKKCKETKPNDAEADLRGVWVRLYKANEVEDYLESLIRDEDFQKIQAGRARDAIKSDLLKDHMSLGRLAAVSLDSLLDCLAKTSQPALRDASAASADSSGAAGKKLIRLLSVSIIDKLRDRYAGDQDLMTGEISTIVQTARNFVQFSQAERDRLGLGVSEGNAMSSLAIAMPDADRESTKELRQHFQDACAGTLPVFVDTGERRRHEITILSFKQLFPLRFVALLEFLKQEYERIIGGAAHSAKTRIELHTEGDAKMYPSLYVPSMDTLSLPTLLAGMAVGAVKARHLNASDRPNFKGEIFLAYIDPASELQTLELHDELGKGYKEAVRKFVVEKQVFHRLADEVKRRAAGLSDEERRSARERIVGLVSELAENDSAARSVLGESAEKAVALLDHRD